MVQPMSGFSGYVTYMQYALGTVKGSVGGEVADPFITIAGIPTQHGSNYTVLFPIQPDIFYDAQAA